MNKREELVNKYEEELRNKFSVDANKDLLMRIAIALGPSIYNSDSSTVSSSDEKELERVKTNFLINKLGLEDGPHLDKAINDIIVKYGKTNRRKYRVVIYYLLVKHFKKEDVY